MNERRSGASRPGQPASRPGGQSRRKARREAAAPSQLSGPAPAERPWSVPVSVSDIPQTGRRVALVADPAVRAAVAKLAGLVSLPRLAAVFDLMPFAGDGVRVSGQVSAVVEQNCVVTLDAMENQVEEAVELEFRPQPDAAPAAPDSASGLDEMEPPENLIGGVIDLGAIATEFLILGLDPYPRKPDAAFAASPEPADPADHPFAALAALKKETGGQNH